MFEIAVKKTVLALLEKEKWERAKRKLERTAAGVNLKEQIRRGTLEQSAALTESGEALKASMEGLTEKEREAIKKETGWPDQIISGIQTLDQYKLLEGANLTEMEINGRTCLVKKDLDFTDEDSISCRRMKKGRPPLDAETGSPLELHHLGQKPDSPLVELTAEEHRTGEFVPGKKNQGLWHDRTIKTEVHGQGNTWDQERGNYWKARVSDRTKELNRLI